MAGIFLIQVSGKYAYVACGDGLRIVDVSDPANLRAVGFCSTPSPALAVHIPR